MTVYGRISVTEESLEVYIFFFIVENQSLYIWGSDKYNKFYLYIALKNSIKCSS